jgi:hypothetical protein
MLLLLGRRHGSSCTPVAASGGAACMRACETEWAHGGPCACVGPPAKLPCLGVPVACGPVGHAYIHPCMLR